MQVQSNNFISRKPNKESIVVMSDCKLITIRDDSLLGMLACNIFATKIQCGIGWVGCPYSKQSDNNILIHSAVFLGSLADEGLLRFLVFEDRSRTVGGLVKITIMPDRPLSRAASLSRSSTGTLRTASIRALS